jgi:hypothetical protein
MAGQSVSGDTFVCQPFDGGTLVCAIDGLGHGEGAAEASGLARKIMERHPEEPLEDLVRRCDSEMRHTRGAVASLARFDHAENAMSWLGVGNVDGVLIRFRDDDRVLKEGMASRGGVIGYQLPPMRVNTFDVRPGDILVFATDGLAGAFADNINHLGEPQVIAQSLLRDYGKTTDDALVVAVRYLGGERH